MIFWVCLYLLIGLILTAICYYVDPTFNNAVRDMKPLISNEPFITFLLCFISTMIWPVLFIYFMIGLVKEFK